MTRHGLANELRQRQYDKGILERHEIDAVSDDDMIDAYTTCSCCGVKQVDGEQLANAIWIARDAEQFFQICGSMGTTHEKEEEDDDDE